MRPKRLRNKYKRKIKFPLFFRIPSETDRQTKSPTQTSCRECTFYSTISNDYTHHYVHFYIVCIFHKWPYIYINEVPGTHNTYEVARAVANERANNSKTAHIRTRITNAIFPHICVQTNKEFHLHTNKNNPK